MERALIWLAVYAIAFILAYASRIVRPPAPPKAFDDDSGDALAAAMRRQAQNKRALRSRMR